MVPAKVKVMGRERRQSWQHTFSGHFCEFSQEPQTGLTSSWLAKTGPSPFFSFLLGATILYPYRLPDSFLKREGNKETYWVRRVNAADVMEDGRCRPLMISCHNFLLMTSTSPPRATTRLYNSYKSNTCLAIIGKRVMGVPISTHTHTQTTKHLIKRLIGNPLIYRILSASGP